MKEPMSENTQLAVASDSTAPGFFTADGFALAQRIANAFANSSLVPQAYQGNVANCIIAAEMSHRMGASPLMVMQNLYIVHGNPGWSSKFLVACFNQSGRFSALRYDMKRDEAGKPVGCRAWAIEKSTGERLEGTLVTLEMAQAEGWSTKSGSKWKTMPELMLQYRAAAFFIRVYAPEISMGLQTDDELRDVVDMDTGEITSERAGKPPVRMPTARAETPLAERVDEEEAAANAEAKPEVEEAAADAEQPAAEAKPVEERAPNAALATEGEKKMIVTRARNNSVDMLDLIDRAGLNGLPLDLAGLTKDGFVALKEALPKAA